LLLETIYAPHFEPIHRRRTRAAAAAMHRLAPVALCLSGGGIRSATFGLGVLQGLAWQKILPAFDYLSTVSGGGYIGGWFTSWLARHKNFSSVVENLAEGRGDPLQPEATPIAHLRTFSNFLTPKLGLFSVDTWTIIATYLRNLVLIWAVLLPAMMAVLVLPRLWVVALKSAAAPLRTMTIAMILGGTATVLLLAFLRPIAGENDAIPSTGFGRRIRACGVQLVIGFALFQAFTLSFLRAHNGGEVPPLGQGILVTVLCFVLAWVVYVVRVMIARRSRENPTPSLVNAARPGRQALEALAAVVSGVGTGLFFWLFARMFPFPLAGAGTTPRTYGALNVELFATFGPGAYLLLVLFQTTIFSGVAGKRNDDEDREWWARWAAWTLIFGVGVTGINVIVLLGPILLGEFPRTLTSLGGVAGVLTLLIGRSGASPATQAQVSKAHLNLRNALLVIAAPLFALVLLILLAHATNGIVIRMGALVFPQESTTIPSPRFPTTAPAATSPNALPAAQSDAPQEEPSWRLSMRKLPRMGRAHAKNLRESRPRVVWTLFATLLLATLLSSVVVHSNRFSMHALYRNRLVRAFLGATNAGRRPDRFTGFDEHDNLYLSELPHRPFHVINIALNLVGGENLAWQQRKAEPFTASPLHAGAARLGFRAVDVYAEGLTLGTSMAISGAAVSPNMGYHTSPTIAFLLTLFNVRLGWWLPNPGFPGQHTYKRHSPNFALLPILYEAFGQTNSRRPWVYLSDGGHFENLGLYEMVRRRCRTIIVSDAGRDPEVAFEDLGNAIRKIRIDLGIPIAIDDLRIHARSEGSAGKYHALGIIHYDAVDAPIDGQSIKGTLVYLKPSIYGREPADVYNYARENKGFPHETTADQWFTESQFESYRALGLHVIKELCGRTDPPAGTLEEFLLRVDRHGTKDPNTTT
jgi:hypothetical protein